MRKYSACTRHNNSAGAAMVELAIVLPLILLLLIGLFDIGWALHKLSQLNFVANEAIRNAAASDKFCRSSSPALVVGGRANLDAIVANGSQFPTDVAYQIMNRNDVANFHLRFMTKYNVHFNWQVKIPDSDIFRPNGGARGSRHFVLEGTYEMPLRCFFCGGFLDRQKDGKLKTYATIEHNTFCPEE